MTAAEMQGSGVVRSGPGEEQITVCICTFRRKSVIDAAHSVERQIGVDVFGVSVIIVDNDETDAMRPEIEEMAKKFTFPLSYQHAPARNISIARNAALDATTGRWLAFIDDDEIADGAWLSRLAAHRSAANVVVGRSQATYRPSLPDWLQRCDFHSNSIEGSPVNAYTSNVLIDMDIVRSNSLRFLEELGRTGGEDTVFFHQMHEVGARFVYEPDAVVFEDVPDLRANMRWVQTRKYRSGQTHGMLTKKFDPASFRKLGISASAKMVFSAGMAVLTLPGTDASRKWWARACLHAGALHYWIKPQILEEYS